MLELQADIYSTKTNRNSQNLLCHFVCHVCVAIGYGAHSWPTNN